MKNQKSINELLNSQKSVNNLLAFSLVQSQWGWPAEAALVYIFEYQIELIDEYMEDDELEFFIGPVRFKLEFYWSHQDVDYSDDFYLVISKDEKSKETYETVFTAEKVVLNIKSCRVEASKMLYELMPFAIAIMEGKANN